VAKLLEIIIFATVVVAISGFGVYLLISESSHLKPTIQNFTSKDSNFDISEKIRFTSVFPKTLNFVSSTVVAKHETEMVEPKTTPSLPIVSSSTFVDSNISISPKEQFQATVTLAEWKSENSSSTPIALKVDSKGSIWYTEDSKHIIGRLNPATQEITEWSLPLQLSYPRGITVDLDGIVWFSEVKTNMIGRLDPFNNQFSEWRIPTPFSHPIDVVIDSSGNVFFTEDNGNKIGRLNPTTNEITEWYIPTQNLHITSNPYNPSSRPFTLALDMEDNIWFGELDGNKIGRLNPTTNEITEWEIPSLLDSPTSIAVDKTENVFFVSDSGNKISRLNSINDEVTEWSLPTKSSLPRAVIVSSDGMVWFTELKSKIGRLNPATNEIVEVSVPSVSSFPRAIVVDSDDNLWFIESGGKKFGRLNLD